MKIEHTYPPNIEAIRAKFKLSPNTVFTYGSTLHNPGNGEIDVYLETHEETHERQQLAKGVEEWWKKYLDDNQFRFDQELEAYQNQFEHFCDNKKNPMRQEAFLNLLGRDLSGPMYGNVCTLEEAKQKIRKYEDSL